MTADGRGDIGSADDILRLVDRFYSRAMSDPLIGFLFTDIAQLDLESHRPVIASFWERLLLGSGDYGGGTFAVHRHLHEQVPLQSGHFDRWVVLWTEAVNELFTGPVAEAACAHGRRIAAAFYRRLQRPDDWEVNGSGAGTGLVVTLVPSRGDE